MVSQTPSAIRVARDNGFEGDVRPRGIKRKVTGRLEFDFDLVCSQPDWIPPEILDMVKDDKERCMSEHGTKQGWYRNRD